MDRNREPLGLSEAAEIAGCSRDTIRRAAQKEELVAEMGPGVRGPQWWIQESDLLEWVENREKEAALSSASAAQQAPCSAQHGKRSSAEPVQSSAQQEFYEAEWNALKDRDREDKTPPLSPPAEVYIELIDRLSRSERRSIELEIQLRQSQRLLTENAESITEKEALAKEAQAKLQAAEDAKREEMQILASELELRRESEAKFQEAEKMRSAEIERLNAELESTRQQLVEATTKKPSGFFSWLGLRKRRTTTTDSSTSKAI